MSNSNISDFKLVVYLDKETDEVVRIEQYEDNDTSSMYSDIDSYSYGYKAIVIKPEELIEHYLKGDTICMQNKR